MAGIDALADKSPRDYHALADKEYNAETLATQHSTQPWDLDISIYSSKNCAK